MFAFVVQLLMTAVGTMYPAHECYTFVVHGVFIAA